ncbi:MAG: type II secretion system F family protein, partial [Calditrichales bacterium]|nr:type II secretion system F family protein [Calditrichales bacterium]
ETIKIIQESIQNKIFRKELVLSSEKIRNGYKMAPSLEQSPYFSSSLVEMIAIGEKSGSLDEMLKSAADYYDNEVSTSVESMTAMMEPIITAALGIIVLFLASALFLPMWDIIGNLK